MNEVKRIGFAALGQEEKVREVVIDADDNILDYTGKFTSHPYIGVNFGTELNSNPGFFETRRNAIAGYNFSFVEAYNISQTMRAGLGSSYTIYNVSRKERVASFMVT